MRRKKKWGLAAALAAISSLFIFAGCTVGESLEEIVEENDLVAQVTYYANGGDFGVTVSDTTDRENVLLSQKKELYYKDGSKIADIGNVMLSNGSIDFERRDYDFAGWYYVETDVDGNIVYEVNEVDGVKYMKLGDKVDFSKTIEDGEHWYLCAAWTPRVKVKMKLVCDTLSEGETIKGKFGEKEAELKNGDIVHEFSFSTKGKVESVSDSWTPSFVAENGTYVAYYADEACTQEVQWPISNTENTDVFIYAKYLEGAWTVLRTADDVSGKLFGFAATQSDTKFYLYDDIDMAGKRVAPLDGFAATLEGNGHTISGLTVESTLSQTNATATFGILYNTAVMKNVTFDNMTVQYNVSSNVNIKDEDKATPDNWKRGYQGYLVYTTRGSAVVENVVINATMTVSIGEYSCVENFWDETNQQFGGDSWKFGDGSQTGFTVTATVDIQADWWADNQ